MHKPEQIKISIARPDGGVTIMAFVTKSFLPNGDGKTAKMSEHRLQLIISVDHHRASGRNSNDGSAKVANRAALGNLDVGIS